MGTKKIPPVGKIVVRRDDGTAYDVEIQAPGAAVRFTVGNPGAHGFVWRLWSSKHTPDFYLAIRDSLNGGDSKYSFHASGDWRLQYEYSKAQALGIHRVLESWERPTPGPNGAICVARVMIPSDDIVATGRREPNEERIVFVTPGPPHALNVLPILLVPSRAEFVPPSDAAPLAAMQLANGSTVLVLHTIGQMTAVEEDMFQRLRLQTSKNPPPGATEPYVPRSDPAYRCEGFLRAADSTADLVITDLLM